jgi:3-methyladenine DNA glycosylase AlkC
MRHITQTIYTHLPADFKASLDILTKVAPQFKGFQYMFFPEFVELYGIDNLQLSLPALELFTQYSSAEFAVRPFIIKYPREMMQQMLAWAQSPNHHVRRLASEGCRPRLPWAMALPMFKKNPSPVLPVLEILKTDDSLYVRRSVANNLNDISKEHPELVLTIAESWKNMHPDTDWIIKHACRGLLKKGNIQALALFDFKQKADISIENLTLATDKIEMGSTLKFSFSLILKNPEQAKLRLEYGMYYLKANGTLSRKVFKIKEGMFSQQMVYIFTRKLAFRPLTTRKHYPGTHKISLIINGNEHTQQAFELLN